MVSRAVVLTFCLFSFVPFSATSAELLVTSFADTNDPGTLRTAIATANSNNEADTITIDASLDGEFLSLGLGVFEITEVGHKTTIDASTHSIQFLLLGDQTSRIFEVAAGASLELANIEVSDGKADDGADGSAGASPTNGVDGAHGGGIYNEGELVVRDSVVTFCFAGNGGAGGLNQGDDADAAGMGGAGGDGGGIYSAGSEATVQLIDSRITNNGAGAGGDGGSADSGDIGDASPGTAGGNGGGIYAKGGSLTIERTVFQANSAGVGGSGGYDGDGGVGASGGRGGNGGGIYADQLVLFSVVDSEVSINSAGDGGEIAFVDIETDRIGGPGGDGGNGGGIYVNLLTSAIGGHLSRSTLRQNQAGAGGAGGDAPDNAMSTDDASAGGRGGDGGGIFVTSEAGTDPVWTMENCTVRLNFSGDGGSGGLVTGTGTGGDGGDSGSGGAMAFGVGASDFTALLRHLTVAGNSTGFVGFAGSAGASDGDDGIGGGIFESPGGVNGGSPGITVGNCVVASNSGGLPTNTGTVTEEGNNFLSGDPQLDDPTIALGGLTEILPPLTGSPLINGGGTLTEPSTEDQRGSSRPKAGVPDIGAVELGFATDALVGLNSNPATQKVNDGYSPTGVGQTQRLRLEGRKRGRAHFSVQNDGEVSDTITVVGSRANRTVRLRVRYLSGGGANVTGGLVSGLALGAVEPGGLRLFQVQAKARSRDRRARQNLLYTAIGGEVGSTDAVIVRVRQSNK